MSFTGISCTRNTEKADHREVLRQEIASNLRLYSAYPIQFKNFTEVTEYCTSSIGYRAFRTTPVLPIVEAQASKEGNNCFDVIKYIRNLSRMVYRPIVIYEVGVSHSYQNATYTPDGYKDVISSALSLNYGMLKLEGDYNDKVGQIRSKLPDLIELVLREKY